MGLGAGLGWGVGKQDAFLKLKVDYMLGIHLYRQRFISAKEDLKD